MARHITSLAIDGYRGLCGFSAKNLADVNILLGDNNSGKTSVLEVLDTFSSITSPGKWLNNSSRRRALNDGVNPCAALEDIFNINNPDTPIFIEYSIEENNTDKLSITHKTDEVALTLSDVKKMDGVGYLRTKIQLADELERITNELKEETDDYNEDGIEHRIHLECLHSTMIFAFNDESEKTSDFFEFSTKIKGRKKSLFKTEYEYPYKYMRTGLNLSDAMESIEMYDALIEVLQEFDEDITRIYADKEDNNVVYKIASRKNNKALPVSAFGDGLKLALSVFAAIPRAKDGFLLIDEFDSSLHTSQIRKVLCAIITMCRRMNIQLFMTTHSIEAVDKVIDCCDENLDDLRIIRITKKPDHTFTNVINGKTAEKLRNVNGADLR